MPAIVGTNSYISKADANSFFLARLHSSKWTAAPDADKEASLIQATRMLDEMFDFQGDIAETSQVLRWPRSGVIDDDGRELSSADIPASIKNAVCEQAIYLLSIDATQKPTLLMQGFKTASAGSLSVEADTSKRPDMICQSAIAAVGSLGTPRCGAVAGGVNILDLIRG